jgi:hypothetical protein
MGLAIATVALSGVSTILYLVLMFNLFDSFRGLGAWFGFMQLFVVLNPLNALQERTLMGAVGTGSGDVTFVYYVLPLMEVARLCVFALYLWAAGKCLRDESTASSGFTMGIVAPSTFVGFGLIVWLISLALKNVTTPWPGIILHILYGGTIVGILAWYAFIIANARGTFEEA